MSLYIHIPFCISKCAYCDFFSKPFSSVSDDYVQALCNELDYRLKDGKSPETIYIGGGTPSLLSKNQLKKIVSHIPFDSVKEFTVEVNPDDVTVDLLQGFEKCGVTRISCGIQSLNDDVLKICNRRANREQVLNALETFNQNWKGRLSLDLISGLPLETEESFFEGLETVFRSGAEHISLYALTIEEETPLGRKIDSGEIEYDYDIADKMWLMGRDFLEAHGYSQYEVSNFCKDEEVSLHNMTYWTHKSYVGCGSGGTGTLYRDDGSAFRWTNTSNLREYVDFWLSGNCGENIPQESEELSLETEKFEFFMMGLRTVTGISKNQFEKTFACSFPEGVKNQFEKWNKEELSEIHTEGDDVIYTLGKKGILFLNRFLSELEI
ncbi:MAG: radical SAM family heme chaperone HemW [Treponema sp.]|nr:radical SAM family heme chaperone HemW [Treponema sp.]